MIWEYIRAEDFCDSVRDGTHDTPKPVSNGYKLVTGKHIKNGQIDPTGAYFISEADYNAINTRSLVEQWDVIMSMIGTVGEAAVVKCKPDYAIKNVALFKCGGSELKGKWLNYYLHTPMAKGKIVGNMKGSSQQFLSLQQLRDLQVPTGDSKLMKDIVGILSVYDDMIENNQKQIKLLEEAAQRLYKEWFVYLRFPGYEKNAIVDGVPLGWAKTELGHLNCRLEAGLRPKGGIDSSISNGIPSIGAENVLGLGRYNYSSEKLIPNNFFEKMKKGKITNKDILIYKDGAYIGRTSLFQDNFPYATAAINEHVFLLHMADERLQYYVFFTLYQNEYYLKMQHLNKNAAQPGINAKSMLSLALLVPPMDLIERFDSYITPIMKILFAKAKQNQALSQARDRLLPKLMSGELEV